MDFKPIHNAESNAEGCIMKTFKYPEQLEAMNEYINLLPSSNVIFDNKAGTATVEEVKQAEVAPDAV